MPGVTTRDRRIDLEGSTMSNTSEGVGTTALNLRKFDPSVKERAKHLAGARGLMLPAYFERLVAMHEALIAKAATGDKHAAARLREVGLDPVTR